MSFDNLTRTEKRKVLMRKQLINAAMESFLEIGYTKTTVNDITTRADVGHGTFYQHFKNKQELLEMLVDELAEKVDDFVQPKELKLNIYERMRYEAKRILEYYVSNRSILMALKEAMMVDRQFEEKWNNISESLFRRIERDIKGSVKKGYCHDMNVDVTIRALTCTFEGYGHYLMMDPPSCDNLNEIAESITSLCYRAVFKTDDNQTK
ncbi:TetR/AcrR family transcriptional regulator [Bacillus sp. EB600]|uniref:TetR/AcrR family transcriptional regulator n=1 Tax=Bacillus sp. EB600 TaxID=2806345 RepID=UPI00210966BE|nr:TetR/AcrR family transcriptional regulator [Bacillus sp. EB600]MCQ6281658.1 TetR/AcrR family transcriptional regulator [Bacillus sp. EB600]